MGQYSLPYTKDEIAAMYRDAKDKVQQIDILAQMNNCTTARIYQILKETGITPKSSSNAYRKRKLNSAQEKDIETIPQADQKIEPHESWLNLPPLIANEIIEDRMRGLEAEIRYHKQIIKNSIDIITERERIYKALAEHLAKG